MNNILAGIIAVFGLMAAAAQAFPTGSLTSISAQGQAVGSASDPSYPGQSVTVDFWIGPANTFKTYLGGVETVNGRFSYTVSAEHVGKQICAYAKNRAAPNHPNIGCTIWTDIKPVGSVSTTEGRANVVSGSGYDPNSPTKPLRVDFWVPRAGSDFGDYLGHTTTDGSRNYTFAIPESFSGRQVCAWGINDLGADHTKFGCYRHGDLRYFGYFQDSTPFRYGRGNYVPEVAGHTNLSWLESADCKAMASDGSAAHFCDTSSAHVETYRTVAGSTGQLNLSDLVYRIENARKHGQKVALQLQQFLFQKRADGTDENRKVMLRADYQNILRAISRHLGNRGLLGNVALVYPLDEPYDVSDTAYNAELASSLQALTGTIKSEGLFAGAPIGVIFAYNVVNKLCKASAASCSSNARVSANFDWIGYDGYLSTGEMTQNYEVFITALKQVMTPSQRLMVVPEAHVYPKVKYPSSMCNRTAYPSLALDECVVLSNFDKLYKVAKENNAIAVVPFQWQVHSDGVAHRPGARSLSAAARGRLTQVGSSIKAGSPVQ